MPVGAFVFCRMLLSYLQRQDGKCCKQESYDAETQHDLRFVVQVAAAFAQDTASRVILQDLFDRCAEMIVERCTFEYADTIAATLAELINLCLQDNGNTLHQENTAQDWNKQLLVDNHGTNADDTADSQTAGVTHENLCREAVEPEEADQCADESTEKNNQFFAAGNVHDIEVIGEHGVAGDVCQHNKRDANQGTIAGTHTIHSIVEIGSVAHGSNDKNGE